MQKLSDFVEAVSQEMPQIIALQEVNQTSSEADIPQDELLSYYPSDSSTTIRKDNHVYNAVKLLRQRGITYYWTWIALKKGYDKYDEGIALMSLSPIVETDILLISNINDYNDWKTRKILGIRTEAMPEEWFYSVHFGWWNDKDEPFCEQWKKTDSYMMKYDTVWLMGDFNSPAQVRNEGYDMIIKSYWQDSFVIADKKDSGVTVEKVIDGWKDKSNVPHGMRIDQIWCSKKTSIRESKTIFNGENFPVVSDHYGVIIDCERS